MPRAVEAVSVDKPDLTPHFQAVGGGIGVAVKLAFAAGRAIERISRHSQDNGAELINPAEADGVTSAPESSEETTRRSPARELGERALKEGARALGRTMLFGLADVLGDRSDGASSKKRRAAAWTARAIASNI